MGFFLALALDVVISAEGEGLILVGGGETLIARPLGGSALVRRALRCTPTQPCMYLEHILFIFPPLVTRISTGEKKHKKSKSKKQIHPCPGVSDHGQQVQRRGGFFYVGDGPRRLHV
jgi:hypothetical protein